MDLLKQIEDLNITETNAAGIVVLNSEFETKVKEFLEIKKKVDSLDKVIKEKLTAEFQKHPGMNKFEGELITCGESVPVNKVIEEGFYPIEELKRIVEENDLLSPLKTEDKAILFWIMDFLDSKLNMSEVNEYIKESTTKVDGKKHYLLPPHVVETTGAARLSFKQL